jgi:hypothetical protein
MAWSLTGLEIRSTGNGDSSILLSSSNKRSVSSNLTASTRYQLGYSLVWPKALVFEISNIGSNPITPASLMMMSSEF